MSSGKGKTPFRIVVILPLLLLTIALASYFWPNFHGKDHFSGQSEANLEPPLLTPLPQTPETMSKTAGLFPPALSSLGRLPDWSQLDRFQQTITREEFLHRLDTIYSKNEGWKRWIATNDKLALINTGNALYTLKFTSVPLRSPGAIFPFKKKSDLISFKSHRLTGLHIAIDPGHIGGDFAKIEERNLRYGDHEPIQEGTMTLLTSTHLKALLEELGAQVTLVRKTTTPVTSLRPRDFTGRDQKSAEKLFYRSAEIRARADLINQSIQPDLVLCLHFNAAASPVPLAGQNFHIILNGAYHPAEISNQDERFEMLQHLLAGTISEELPLAKKIAEIFASQTGLPAYEYRPNHPYATKLAPYIWGRNLLANRLYQCPVIFMEPYTMNSTDFIARHKAGDYEGQRLVDGKMRLSVYREYAKALADGVAAYYRKQ